MVLLDYFSETFTSFCFFALLYKIFPKLLKTPVRVNSIKDQKAREEEERFYFTRYREAIVAIGTVFMSIYSVLTCSHSFGSANTYFENLIFSICLGFFLFEFVTKYVANDHDIDILVHHFVSIMIFGAMIHSDRDGYSLVVMYTLTEFASQFYFVHLILCEHEKHQNKAFLFDVFQFVFFMIGRVVITSVVMGYFMTLNLSLFIKFGGIGICELISLLELFLGI